MKLQLPNVILITIDDLRADHISLYGYSKNTTPNLERLAKKGILFEQAITVGGYTPFAFPPILASVPPPLNREEFRCYIKNKTTIAEILKEKGYCTAAFVSNPHLSRFYNYDKGFDVFEDNLMSKTPIQTSSLRRTLRHIKPLRYAYHLLQNLSLKLPYMTVEETNNKAVSWLKQQSGHFFLWLHYMDVHPPYISPEKYIEEFCDRPVSRRKIFHLSRKRMSNKANLSLQEKELLSNLYDAGIKYVDDGIAEFLKQLQQIQSNTIVIITSDHGDGLGELGSDDFVLYEVNIHVPLIIYYPKIGQGIVVKQQVSLIDLAPTIIDLIGCERVPNFHGKSLLPLIRGEMVETGCIISIDVEPVSNTKHFSCRTEKWKLIVTEGAEDRLYNLQNDPGETINLIDKEQRKARELKSRILDYISQLDEERRQPTAIKLGDKIQKLKESGKI